MQLPEELTPDRICNRGHTVVAGKTGYYNKLSRTLLCKECRLITQKKRRKLQRLEGTDMSMPGRETVKAIDELRTNKAVIVDERKNYKKDAKMKVVCELYELLEKCFNSGVTIGAVLSEVLSCSEDHENTVKNVDSLRVSLQAYRKHMLERKS